MSNKTETPGVIFRVRRVGGEQVWHVEVETLGGSYEGNAPGAVVDETDGSLTISEPGAIEIGGRQPDGSYNVKWCPAG